MGCISFISVNNSYNHVAQSLAGFAKEKVGLLFGLKNVPPFSSLLYHLIYFNAIAITFNSKKIYTSETLVMEFHLDQIMLITFR